MGHEQKRYGRLEIGLLVSLTCLCASPLFAQSLGEVARKNRAREKAQPPQHIYTNDDLARPVILLPRDQARFQADRKAPSNPTSAQTAANPATVRKPLKTAPLGDVARYYRLQKQLRHLENQENLPGLDSGLEVASPKPSISSPPERTRPANLPAPVLRHVLRPLTGTQPASPGSVRIVKGDSLWKLAKEHLGRGSRWRELAALNPQITNPRTLRVGQWIQLPHTASPAGNATRVRVHSGDTLWRLAQASFGTGLAWTCVAQANPDLRNPDLIYPGQSLVIPPSCSSVR
jgi:nucleoid-associated protein YgaU